MALNNTPPVRPLSSPKEEISPTSRRAKILYAVLFILSSLVATVYVGSKKEKDRLFFARQRELSELKAKIDQETELHYSLSKDERWTLIVQKDDMTDKQTCIIESPESLLESKDLKINLTIRALTSKDNEPLIAIFSSLSPLSRDTYNDESPRFSFDANGMGIKVGTHDFIEASKTSDRVVLFNIEKSRRLFEQISNNDTAKVRVTFTNNRENIDSDNISLKDFNYMLRELEDCNKKM